MSVLRKGLAGLAFVVIAAVFGIGAIALVGRTEAAANPAGEWRGGRGGFCGAAGLEAAAQALGLTAEALETQLRAGESLADVAEAEGADLSAVLNAVKAACVQATRDAIAEAVTDGALSQAHADWLNEGLDQGFWGPAAEGQGKFGFGFGGPRGGFGGLGGHRFERFDDAPPPLPVPTF